MNMTDRNKSPIKLKGVGNSLWVTFDPTQPVDFLQEELTKLFKRMKHLVVNARIVLDPGEQEDCDDLVNKLRVFLKDTFDVGAVSKPPVKRAVKEERIRQRDVASSWHNYAGEVLMLTGRVRSGQKIAAKKHVLILGDVNPGGEIIAGGDIVVMGSLCGTVSAGQPDNEDSIVLSLDFRPTQVQIGGLVAAGIPSSRGKTVEFASVEDNAIVVKDYLKANPFGRLPQPLVR
jgi:septum site-determining protein MinC